MGDGAHNPMQSFKGNLLSSIWLRKVDCLQSLPSCCIGAVSDFLYTDEVFQLRELSKEMNRLASHALTWQMRHVNFYDLWDPIELARYLNRLRRSGVKVSTIYVEKSMQKLAVAAALHINYPQGMVALLRALDDPLISIHGLDMSEILSLNAAKPADKHRAWVMWTYSREAISESEDGRPKFWRGRYGNTALHTATAGAHVNAVEYLLKTKVIPVNVKNFAGDTPFHQAMLASNWKKSRRRTLAVVDRFLACDALDVNAKNRRGRTPIMHAIAAGRVTFVSRLMCDERVDLSATDASGATLLHVAARNGCASIVHMFLRDADGRFDAQINARDSEGRTPLLAAAARGRLGAIAVLFGDERVDASAADESKQDYEDLLLVDQGAAKSIERRIREDHRIDDDEELAFFDLKGLILKKNTVSRVLQFIRSDSRRVLGDGEDGANNINMPAGLSPAELKRQKIVEVYSKYWTPHDIYNRFVRSKMAETITKYC